MAGASGGKLAAQVTLGGGFGFAAAGYTDSAAFAHELEVARTILGSSPGTSLAIGAGFLGWTLDQGGSQVDMLRIALEYQVQCIWLSFGDNLGKWVEYIHQYDKNRTVPHKTLIWILVNSVAEAEQATKEWKVDILVVQGIEAGGHGHGQALPLITLLPLVKRTLPNPPPLVAAGGLATGAQIAALLVLGASGGVPGTRFLATPESTYTSNQKKAVLAATSSVRTKVFDEVRGTIGWPEGIDGRGLPNRTLEDKASGLSLDELKKRFSEAVKDDDTSRTVVWSGSSVGLINELIGAEDLTRQLDREIVASLNQISTLVGV
ncbi:2-nitropropane dioxygenase [Ramaria rubella]|nr:2-nitropropane dioxygenase [Ramaria rubella]